MTNRKVNFENFLLGFYEDIGLLVRHLCVSKVVGSSLNTVDFVKGGEVRNLASWCQDNTSQHQRRADKGQQEVAGWSTPSSTRGVTVDRVCLCVPPIFHLRFNT